PERKHHSGWCLPATLLVVVSLPRAKPYVWKFRSQLFLEPLNFSAKFFTMYFFETAVTFTNTSRKEKIVIKHKDFIVTAPQPFPHYPCALSRYCHCWVGLEDNSNVRPATRQRDRFLLWANDCCPLA